MNNLVLKRNIGEYFILLSGLIVSGLSLLIYCAGDTFRHFDKIFFFWTFSIACVVNAAGLFIRLKYPKMEIRDEVLGFFPTDRMRFRWIRLPLAQIDEIIEGQRKTGGIARLKNLPTFTFRMRDGSMLEYFPELPAGKKLDEVRGFIEQFSNHFGITHKIDQGTVLDNCRKGGLQLILWMVGIFTAILVLSYVTHRSMI